MPCVLHPSIPLAWAIHTDPEQPYADRVLDALVQNEEAVVPGGWATSIAIALQKLCHEGFCSLPQRDRLLLLLGELAIVPDPLPPTRALAYELLVADTHDVPTHDAPYIALCLRTRLPLAALDADLCRTASRLQVSLYEPSVGQANEIPDRQSLG